MARDCLLHVHTSSFSSWSAQVAAGDQRGEFPNGSTLAMHRIQHHIQLIIALLAVELETNLREYRSVTIKDHNQWVNAHLALCLKCESASSRVLLIWEIQRFCNIPFNSGHDLPL